MASTLLQQLIIERIQREGPLTLAAYMRMALYEPTYGYYVTGQAKMGWEGDYYTSTDISSFFARSMGRQLQQMWEKLGQPVPFIGLEQGAGRGDLARGVRAWATQAAPDFNAALDYRTEDIRLGQDILDLAPARGATTYQDSLQPGNVVAPLAGARLSNAKIPQETEVAPSVILSNELVDAFPVHVVEIRDKRLYEIYVGVQEGRLCEVLDEPSSPEVANYLDSYNIPWPTFREGWRAEINLDALRWLRQTARRLSKRGFILTIDYGDRAKKLYTPYRHHGTLTCYFQHQVNERPLARPGQQDITAHVNFSALIDEARCQGLHLSKLTTQRLWLEGLGLHEELERLRSNEFVAMDTERASDRGQIARLQWLNLQQRVAALTDPAGMGNFKVLILRR